MKKKGKELEFISLVKRDGSETIPVGTEWKSGVNLHPRTDDVSYLDDDNFILNTLSLTCETYIASGFNTWVVKVKK
jgi:hypothetical protein